VPLPALLGTAAKRLGEHGALVDRLGRALAAELPLFARDGGFIATAYSPELDELRELRDQSRRTIAALQARYAEATGVASLRIRHNNVIGYYIEVSAANAGKLGTDYIHRQTMAGAMRFTTTALAELESKISSAAERALALELRLFEDLCGDGSSTFAAAGTRPSKRRSPAAAPLSPMIACWARGNQMTVSGSSPAPTWPARAPFCARTR
jgi:DNA mismatch repair protein MutS